jgi:glycosyltransferase involved in cell wall biosynthesis
VGELVSLLMTAYEPRPDWLRTAVDSALGQQDVELELVVVDDGSAEPVGDLLADIGDERLRVVRTEHGGTSHARNAAVAASKGAWIRFVDSDDVLPPDSTAHLLEVARRRGGIAYGSTVHCDEELRPLWTMTCDVEGQAAIACLHDRLPVTLPALLFPRDVVERTGPWEESIAVSQDWDFVLRALELAPLHGDGRPALHYRQHPGSASSGAFGSPRWQLGQDAKGRIIDRYFERHPEHLGTPIERRARAVIDLDLARGHREAYLAHLGRALRLDPAGALRELGTLGRAVATRGASRLRRSLARPAR